MPGITDIPESERPPLDTRERALEALLRDRVSKLDDALAKAIDKASVIEERGTSSPIALKLARIAGKATYLQKTGRNREQGYNYATAADALDMLKPLLAEEHVAVVPTFSVLETKEGATKSGTPTCRLTLLCSVRFIDGDTGAELTATSVGQGIDTGDKAPYKAMTGALKYVNFTVFGIPTGDDPEDDSKGKLEDDSKGKPPAPALAAPPANGKLPAPPAGPQPVDPVKFKAYVEKAEKLLGTERFMKVLAASELLKGRSVYEITDAEKHQLRGFLNEALLQTKGA